ncbi:hypothetical protein EYF80_038797 [Liparis tanakae]|uniref:Uncharacterized protein n=1 Tax=Liparis tanakae TaxID=230148 RepID=A0A4Z2GCY9_9TELE|nr:hypothetical protein EYF80_038797 [Liparis tanakae]
MQLPVLLAVVEWNTQNYILLANPSTPWIRLSIQGRLSGCSQAPSPSPVASDSWPRTHGVVCTLFTRLDRLNPSITIHQQIYAHD